MQPTRIVYGPDPAQFADLYRPSVAVPAGVVVIIHGGFWRSRYDASLGVPLAWDLIERGYAAYNIEYRRVGNGGGWPATGADVSAAIDALGSQDVDLSRVVAVGHSAGGQLAVWAAGRSTPLVALTGVVTQAGVLDLTTSARTGVGQTAVLDLLGGTPEGLPARYDSADPMRRLPLPVPVVCVHAPSDDVVPFDLSRRYVEAATAAGGRARLVVATGDHFTVIDPAAPDWGLVIDAIDSLM